MLKYYFFLVIIIFSILFADSEMIINDVMLISPPKITRDTKDIAIEPSSDDTTKKEKKPTKMDMFYKKYSGIVPYFEYSCSGFCTTANSEEINSYASTDIISFLRDYIGINLWSGAGFVHGETDYKVIIDGQHLNHLRELPARFKDISLERINSIKVDKTRKIIYIETIPIQERIFSRFSVDTGYYHYDGNDLYLGRNIDKNFAFQAVFSNRKTNGSFVSIDDSNPEFYTYQLGELSRFWQRDLSLIALLNSKWLLKGGFIGNEYKHNWFEETDTSDVFSYWGYNKTFYLNALGTTNSNKRIDVRLFHRFTPEYKPNHSSDLDKSFQREIGTSWSIIYPSSSFELLFEGQSSYETEEYNDFYIKSIKSDGFLGPAFIKGESISRIGLNWVVDRGPKALPGLIAEMDTPLGNIWKGHFAGGFKANTFDITQIFTPSQNTPDPVLEKQAWIEGGVERQIRYKYPIIFRLILKTGQYWDKVTEAYPLVENYGYHMTIRDCAFVEPVVYSRVDSLPLKINIEGTLNGFYREKEKYEQRGYFQAGRHFQITKSLSVQGYGRMYLAYQETFDHLLGFGFAVKLSDLHAWFTMYNGTEQRKFGSIKYIEGTYLRYGIFMNLFE
ncbi:MAG: hypothetical protein JXA60_07180 [Candidatus Coatesbacteria bacterium]|nr:hypothetical protein [Candidatus Coatesbacteria bacterium]